MAKRDQLAGKIPPLMMMIMDHCCINQYIIKKRVQAWNNHLITWAQRSGHHFGRINECLSFFIFKSIKKNYNSISFHWSKAILHVIFDSFVLFMVPWRHCPLLWSLKTKATLWNFLWCSSHLRHQLCVYIFLCIDQL